MSGSINISGFTVYTNVDESDDAFNLSAAASLILRGDDVLSDCAIGGPGLVRVSGITEIDDDLQIGGGATFANAGTVIQNGGYINFGQVPAVTLRNLAGAVYELNGSSIYLSDGSQFINNGRFEGYGTVAIDFYDRGGTIVIQAALNFDGGIDRFVNDTITGPGMFELSGGVLDGSNVSTATVNMNGSRILGDVTMSSAKVTLAGLTTFAQGADLAFTNSDANISLNGQIMGGEIDIEGVDRVVTSGGQNQGVTLVGYTAFNNYGDATFGDDVAGAPFFAGGTVLFTTPWVGDTVTIENETGATWNDVGDDSIFEQTGAKGSSVFLNNGTFMENTASGATFGMNVINNGLMEGGANLVTDGDQFIGLDFEKGLSGTGAVDIGTDNVDIAGAVGSGQTLNFVPGSNSSDIPTLTLGDVLGFSGLVTGFDQNGAAVENDQIALSSNWQFQDFVANSGNTGGSLMFTNGSVTTAINLSGTYDPTHFHAAVTAGQTIVTYG